MASWEHLGDIATVAQLTGVDALKLIGMIVKAASTAKMHKKNCRQFAQHLKLIGNLLEQLKLSELKKYPETSEPLELFEDALRRSYILVNSCQDRSYLYLLAMGWNIVHQFRRAQSEIDRYLKIIPLITLVDNARVRERLEMIEKDQREYTLDDDDMKVQRAIMKPEPSKEDTVVLKKSLSCSYPSMPIDEALKKENEKLRIELQHSQANLDVNHCELIQHLLDVTQVVAATSHPCKSSPSSTSDFDSNKESYDESYRTSHDKNSASRNTSSVSSKHDLLSSSGWHSDLLGCCSEPILCIKTLLFPCGTFSKIATAATNKHISSIEACNAMMAYSLIFSCCCYTCCIRRKLRKQLSIQGGLIDDFLSHLMCCCCALVQEHRELEVRGMDGLGKVKTSPPPTQFMEA